MCVAPTGDMNDLAHPQKSSHIAPYELVKPNLEKEGLGKAITISRSSLRTIHSIMEAAVVEEAGPRLQSPNSRVVVIRYHGNLVAARLTPLDRLLVPGSHQLPATKPSRSRSVGPSARRTRPSGPQQRPLHSQTLASRQAPSRGCCPENHSPPRKRLTYRLMPCFRLEICLSRGRGDEGPQTAIRRAGLCPSVYTYGGRIF